MKKISLGIIGPGIVWERVHKNILVRLKDKFEISAFSASSEQSREKIEKEFPGIPFFKDYKDLLKKDYMDAVVIMTPINMNAPVAIAALDSGKDVIMEKPMASSVTEGKLLIEKEKNTKKNVIILEQCVYEQFTDIILDIINSKIIGNPIFYDRLSHGYIGYKENDPLNYGNTTWRIKPNFMLGMLLDSGIHEIAILGKIFGLPKSVYATGTKCRREYGDYDNNIIIFEYEGRLKGFFCHSTFLGNKRNYFNIRGTKGIAWLGDCKIYIETYDGNREEIVTTAKDVRQEMWKEVYNFLANDKKPYYDTEISLNDLKVLEAINKSLIKSCKVNIYS